MAGPDGHQLFAYGSLMDELSLQRTLAHRDLPPPARRLVIHGWERAWNCLSSRTFRTASDPTGPLHRRVVLGIRPRLGAQCEGVVLTVTDRDLETLRRRERAYDLIDLSPSAHGRDPLSPPDPGGTERTGRVLAFVPRASRTTDATEADEPLVIERSYLDECRRGARAHGLIDAAAEVELARTGIPVAEPAP